jgi:hypothetical protein
MPRLNAAAVVGLCAAMTLAGFAVARFAGSPQAAPTPSELAAAIRSAIGEGDVLERTRRAASLLVHLDPANLLEVVAVYDEMLAVLAPCAVRPFVAAWARFDPADALDHVLAWPPGMQRRAGVEAALEGWARRDPPTAQLAFEGAAANYPRLRERLFGGLVAGWASSDREGLDGYIADLPEASQKRATGIVAKARMRTGGADATLRWADSILADPAYDEAFKREIFVRATRAVTRQLPERGAAWVLEHAGKDYAEDRLRIVAELWGGRDARAALGWLSGQAAGTPRDQAVREAFLSWLKSDAADAEAWLASESPTPFHDPALLAYARHLSGSAPEEAIGWCERLLDPDRGQRCFSAVSTRWYRQDTAAAEEWLQQSPLDEEARSKVRTRAKLGRGPQGPRARAAH